MTKKINNKEQPPTATCQASLNSSDLTRSHALTYSVTKHDNMIPKIEQYHTQNMSIISYDDIVTNRSIFNISLPFLIFICIKTQSAGAQMLNKI